jgi:CO/xanthine dehydrogenase FAD-binding subunit
VIATRFAYRAPETAAACVRALGEEPGARVLGGGTWLVPELSRGEAAPTRIVDLRRAGLAGVESTSDGGLRIGAMTTYAELLASDAVAERAPLLRLMAAGVTGGWSIRNQGTLGGSVAAARPQSDAPAALVAAGAEALVAGPDGERALPVAELITGAFATSLAPDELLVALVLPAPAPGTGAGYVKLKRGASSWPIAVAAALVGPGATTLVLGGVAATPLIVDAGAVERIAVAEPWSDALAAGEYRAAVAAPVARRALEMARHDRQARTG